LLQKQKEALINVFFIGEFLGDHYEDIFDKRCPIALVPNRGSKFIKVCFEGVLSLQYFAKGFPNLASEFWDCYRYKTIVVGQPFEI
jgi:hypothetical protein